MFLDWLSGTAAGAKNGSWHSRRALEGIWHKGGMILIVLVSASADWLIGTLLTNLPQISLPFEYSVLICPLVVCWYIVTELGSILENAVALGAPCPAFLQATLKVLNAGIEKVGGKISGNKSEENNDSGKSTD